MKHGKRKNILSVFIALTAILVFFSSPVLAAGAIEEARDGVVMISVTGADGSSGWGSGFAIGEKGRKVEYIVTNFHVIEAALQENGATDKNASIQVVFSAAQGKYDMGQPVYTDATKDIAVLRLSEPTDLRKPLPLKSSDQVSVSDTVYALGYPATSEIVSTYPKFNQSDITITSGIISKKNVIPDGSLFAGSSVIPNVECYQTDTSINSGNSGGPMVDEDGNVIGINTYGGLDVNMNYAIIIDQLIAALDNSNIPYAKAGAANVLLIVLGGVAAAVTIGAAVLLVFILPKRKSGAAGQKPALQSAGAAGSPLSPDAAPTAVSIDTPTIALSDGAKTVAVSKNAALVGRKGQFAGKEISLAYGKVVLGRNPEFCKVLFDAKTPGVSGKHCEVLYRPAKGTFLLTDLGSTYGTFIRGGEKLTPEKPVELQSGDEFFLGTADQTFEVRLG